MKAPQPDAQPYAWAVEYEAGHERLVSFIANAAGRDLAYAESYAARLHGVIVPLFTERRKE